MDHPNICRLLEVYEEPTRLLLVMEKLNGPDLFDAFSKKRRYTETDAVDIVRQILSAVAYCHRNGVCHRDLKLENFCLEDDSENARIKMIDFGLAHSIDDFPMTDSCGTLYYAAPEVLRGGGEYDISDMAGDADITNFYNSLLTGAGGDPPKGTVLSELIVKFFHGDFTPQGFKRYSGLWKGPPPGNIGKKDIAVGVAKLKEQMANPMFVTKGGVGYGVDETQKVEDDGKGWVWLAAEMSPGGLAVELFKSVPYGKRAILVAKQNNVDELFQKVNWDTALGNIEKTFGNYTERCDMWSLGILTYILLDGRAPFMGRNDRQTYRLILQGEYRFAEERWAHVSANAKDFISKLLQVDPQQRMTAEEATVHPWLATSEGAPSVELDRGILDGLKAFSRSNEVKRAVLSAIAPMASVEQVRKWADQFEALDENGTGQIKVSDLVEKVAQQSGEDVHVAEAGVLKLTAGTNQEANYEILQEISYSAFLVDTNATGDGVRSAEEEQFRALFERLDKEKKGKVTVEQVSKALDGLVDDRAQRNTDEWWTTKVDLDGLESDFGARELSFTDFRWLLQRPLTPSSLVGLRQLLGLYEDSGIAKSWRVDTVRAKMAGETDEGAIEAARRENAAWRQWHRARLREEKDEDGKLGQ
ncbi:unnamed protein product [Durusdinium trenchii]|uniref:Calmodulin n=1 Tax=Durusdinium trenchii TaxID=1381693 RepID=A0ABP0Q5D5_9DINO